MRTLLRMYAFPVHVEFVAMAVRLPARPPLARISSTPRSNSGSRNWLTRLLQRIVLPLLAPE